MRQAAEAGAEALNSELDKVAHFKKWHQYKDDSNASMELFNEVTNLIMSRARAGSEFFNRAQFERDCIQDMFGMGYLASCQRAEALIAERKSKSPKERTNQFI